MKIDKSSWTKYRFDEFAENISQRVEPQNTELSTYIGLEHIDPDSLHIKRHGSPSDVEGTKLKFYKGDVIFGKRRAYQRKAALAECDGICSAHAMVLRAQTDVIDNRLFPFFFHSKFFQTRAIDISVGGLSPTVNWKDLAKQEFLLPPKEEQTRLAELLWAADTVEERVKKLIDRLTSVLEINKVNLIWNKKYLYERFSKASRIGLKDGDWIESKDQSESGIRLIQLADIGEGEFLNKSDRYISDSTFKKLKCFEIFEGDILLARMPDPIGRSCILPKLENRSITAVDICVVRVDTQFQNNEYWNYLINTKKFRHKVIELSSGTTRMRISRANLEKIEVPMPSVSQQKEIVKILNSTKDRIQQCENSLLYSQQLKSSLINQIF